MTRVFEELRRYLRPAGGGVHVVSTGVREQKTLQRAIYGADDDDEIEARWADALSAIATARVTILGVPSDCGAGFTRGANRAPGVLRRALLEAPDHPYHDTRVVDAGDVFVVPHLLTDSMLSPEQLGRTRAALYDDANSPLPVAPLDIAYRALGHLRALNPATVPIVIGGDHSVGSPAFHSAHDHRPGLGLLHFDAHTDLLESRLGVTHCFATWAYHANERLGRDGRLVQVGIRASARDREHWESTLGVRQYWPAEVEARSCEDIATEIVARFESHGCEHVYVSNDIDGTDPTYAAATGTPEPGGLTPHFVSELTGRVTERFPIVGGDLVEVAPPLAGELDGEPATTIATSLDYLADLIEAGLRH